MLGLFILGLGQFLCVSQVMGITNFAETTKTNIGLFILTCYIVGAFCSVKIINYFGKLNFKERPINVLIFANEIIYSSITTFTTANILIILIAHKTPIQFFSDFGVEFEQKVNFEQII